MTSESKFRKPTKRKRGRPPRLNRSAQPERRSADEMDMEEFIRAGSETQMGHDPEDDVRTKPTGVYITHRQLRYLKQTALDQDSNVSELLREILHDYMLRHPRD